MHFHMFMKSILKAHPNLILKFSRNPLTLECEKLGNVPKVFKSFATHFVKKFTLIPYGKPLGVSHI